MEPRAYGFLPPELKLIGDFTPGVGQALSAVDAYQAARQGDYKMAAVNALGIVPGLKQAKLLYRHGPGLANKFMRGVSRITQPKAARSLNAIDQGVSDVPEYFSARSFFQENR